MRSARNAVLCTTLVFGLTSFSFAGSPLIDLQKLNPRILIDLRYKTSDNFVGEPMYPEEARCFLLREAAEKLDRVQKALEKKGLGLKVYDGYRPLSVQKKLWAKYPVEGYVANPAKGSNHNRGAAVDLTLVDRSGQEALMPSKFDEFSERAHQDYQGGPEEALRNRQILREAMEAEGFCGISKEWWHYELPNAKTYPVLDLPIAEVEEKTAAS